jgi:Ca2+-binding RTX toxin-like protein
MAGQTGTAKNDKLTGGDEDDVIVGDALNLADGEKGGNDQITGGGGVDVLYGDAGDQDDDTAPFEDGVLASGARGGNDTIRGGDGGDSIQGDGQTMEDGSTGGNDKLFGDADDDFIFGDAFDVSGSAKGGNDTIDGGDGDDTIFGDFGVALGSSLGGADKMTGGAGNDTFHLGRGKDQVKDFVQGEDVLDIGNLGLTFDDLDTDGSGTLTSDDDFVSAKGKNVKIDVGAAAGGTANIDVTTVVVGKGIVLDANDVTENGFG